LEQPLTSVPSTYLRSEAVVSRAIAGETLIVPVRGRVGDLASIYQLNPTASIIWDALVHPLSLRDLASLISSEFEVEVAQAQDDAAAFVEELLAAGLVTCNDQPSGRP